MLEKLKTEICKQEKSNNKTGNYLQRSRKTVYLNNKLKVKKTELIILPKKDAQSNIHTGMFVPKSLCRC